MADDTDVLLKLWEEQWMQLRHIESQRTTAGSFVITFSAAIIGFLGAYGLKQTYLVPSLMLAFLLIALGIYGVVISLKLHERSSLHTRQARKWRKQIALLCPDAKIEELKNQAKDEHKYKYPIFQKIRLYPLWAVLHILVSISGVAFVVIIIKLILTQQT